MYLALVFVHVCAAIVAVGANATYGLWMAAGQKQPASLGFTLRTVKRIDDFVANPAYIVALLSGVALVQMSGLAWSTTWIAAALGLLVLAMIVAYGLYTPTLSRQIAALDHHGPQSAEYEALARRGTALGMVMFAMAFAILVLMVWRPA